MSSTVAIEEVTKLKEAYKQKIEELRVEHAAIPPDKVLKRERVRAQLHRFILKEENIDRAREYLLRGVQK